LAVMNSAENERRIGMWKVGCDLNSKRKIRIRVVTHAEYMGTYVTAEHNLP